MLTTATRDPPQGDVRPPPGWASAVWMTYDTALTAFGCAVAATAGCLAGTAIGSLFGEKYTAEFELGLFGSGILLGVGLCLGAAVGVVVGVASGRAFSLGLFGAFFGVAIMAGCMPVPLVPPTDHIPTWAAIAAVAGAAAAGVGKASGKRSGTKATPV